MATVAISSGHGKLIRGASGLIDEVDEARRVVGDVATLIRAAGSTAREFHDDVSHTQSANLAAITDWHNKQTRDLDVSVHFNAFQATNGARGVEVLHKSQPTLAARVSRAIATAGGLVNRGAKVRTDLSFLNRTRKPAILLEVCFVDSKADVDLYQANYNDICVAITDAILDIHNPVRPPPEGETTRPVLRNGSVGSAVMELQNLLGDLPIDGKFGSLTERSVRFFQADNGLTADGIVGPLTWGALLSEDSNDGTV
jgi:N-acetylmuramoyl-L-alanine amidase